MKILITGYQGFVGQEFWKLLKEQGHDLIGIDIKDQSSCIACLNDPSRASTHDARDFFREDNTYFDLVIHLAAVVGGRLTIEGSPLSVAVDLAIDSELFQWALRTRPGRIVYYSSSAAYPVELQARDWHSDLSEDDIDLSNIDTPDLTYGWAKLTGEMLAQYAEAEGLRVHVFRPFSGYGETQSLDYPFPSFIKRGAEKHEFFEVWGDGEQVRDFIHINDVVEATLEAVRQDVPGPVNLGTGRPTAFNTLAQLVMAQAGYSGEITHRQAAPVGVHYRVADITKMRSFYTPKITLEEGINRALLRYK